MADRYWVGGTGSWSDTAHWSDTSGGTSGFSVPTQSDDVYFDGNSGGGSISGISTMNCLSFNTTGFTGTFTATSSLYVYGNFTLGSGTTWSNNWTIYFQAASGSYTITTAGKSMGSMYIGSSLITGASYTLGGAISASGRSLYVYGSLDTANYALTVPALSIYGTFNAGTSTITISSSISTPTLTVDSASTVSFGSSTISFSSGVFTFNGGGKTYNIVNSTSTLTSPLEQIKTINGQNTFTLLTFAAQISAQYSSLILFGDNQTITTLTLGASTQPYIRPMIRSTVPGAQRTLTIGTFTSTSYYNWQDISVAGAASPITGTMFGDATNNSGITFPSPKTSYYVGSSLWISNSWAATSGGAASTTNYPLPQDTAIIENNYPASGGTLYFTDIASSGLTAYLAVGNIDASSRTQPLTFASGTFGMVLYGDITTSSSVTLSGGLIYLYGNNTQNISCAGSAYGLSINKSTNPAKLTSAFSGSNVLNLVYGTFDANGYNSSFNSFSGNYSNVRTLALGSGTMTLTGSFVTVGTNLTVTGTGTISMSSGSAKTFGGGGIQTWPTLDNSGAGTLTISGSNKFANLTNSYASTGAATIKFTAGTTNEFTNFTLSGSAGKLCTLTSTTTAQATLKKDSAWCVGSNSVNSGNNTGLLFMNNGQANYLDVSYINAIPFAGGDMFLLFGF